MNENTEVIFPFFFNKPVPFTVNPKKLKFTTGSLKKYFL
jgi:hypothetical protein